MSLQDKVVLVTGGAGGLGKAIVKACLISKAKGVVIADINEQLSKETEIELRNNSESGRIATFTLDVSNESSCAAAVDFAVRHFERLDVLINNAGIADGLHSAATCEKDEWDRVMGINLTGPYLMTKYAVKHFLNRGEGTGGSIVNIGSAASQRGAMSGVAYTTSKHALVGLTKNTAAAHAKQGIRTNIVLPGAMQTNIANSMPKNVDMEKLAVLQQIGALQPGLVEVDELAKTVVHLASEESKAINGAVVNGDNGFNAF
ncbi:dehydrogenase with different specificitie [Roridomyces roridus]|uniref:Dehydrogenase with different specificitie n=1 Tax=Roridomyces roridus TaxID=1738132 RepID=A0AAD7FTQ3_9AGAR|nr:dehydrogenase with different specificitie [Roridomyces roridus]